MGKTGKSGAQRGRLTGCNISPLKGGKLMTSEFLEILKNEHREVHMKFDFLGNPTKFISFFVPSHSDTDTAFLLKCPP